MYLEDLALQDNNLTTLHEFAFSDPETGEILTEFLKLQRLDIANNTIENVGDVEYLVSMPLLRNLALQGNPFRMNDQPENEFDTFASYKHHVLNVLRQLSILDGEEITAEEKITAANMFGEDEPHRQEILQRYFAKAK
jgi:Leucine-rich repeat (LRR) protein